MITIHIENRPYTVKEGQNLLQACLSLGFDIPYFCWHPAMHSVGACRQCAVKQFKDEQDTRGKIVMSCMTPATDGARISIDDPEAKSFRKSIIELLMLNHPHDCPVCDEGGECHLQDMTVMTGHVYRRTTFRKRTYPNQYLGPFVTHEMNRCIQCYRCVRFYRDYANGRDLNVFASHDSVYFGRQKDGVLESEFSGNLVEICPTGVYTDKPFQKRYTRQWDLQTAPSVCVHCCVGCNTIPGERYGELRRIRARYNGEVNRYHLCDRGRFGYEFVNSEQRVRRPLIKSASGPGAAAGAGRDGLQPADKEAALGRVRDMVQKSKSIIGIGSPRASLESNFALRSLVGEQNFYSGMSDSDTRLASLIIGILKNGPSRFPSLREVESCDAVLVLGEDVLNTAPILGLSLMQAARRSSLETARKMKIPAWDDAAVRNATQGLKGALSVAAPYTTKLDAHAARVYHAAPDDISRLGFAVAHELDARQPAVAGLDEETQVLAASIAQELRNAQNPLVVSGTGCGSEAVIRAAANIAAGLSAAQKKANLSFVVPECNSLGIGLMGGNSLSEAFKRTADGRVDTAIILENDLYRRADEKSVNAFFAGIKHIVLIDQLLTTAASHAEVVLPAAAFAEADGTLVNNEGRAQRFYQVFVPEDGMQESWRWLRNIASVTDTAAERPWEALDDVIVSLAAAIPVFSPVPDIAPPAGFRVAGMRIARKHHRYSGRTAMFANKTVFEPRPPKDSDSPLAFTMEGYQGKPPSALISRFWAPGWNSPQGMNKFQSEVGGPLQGGDPGRRLIEPPSAKADFFGEVPKAFKPESGKVFFLPVHHIFGSEEMSILSPGIRELTPSLYIGLNHGEMERFHLKQGDQITFQAGGISLTAPLKQMTGLPDGCAAVPVGIPGMPSMPLPAWGTLSGGGLKAGEDKP